MDNITTREFVEIFKMSLNDYLDKFPDKSFIGIELDTYNHHFYAFDKWLANLDNPEQYFNNIKNKLNG